MLLGVHLLCTEQQGTKTADEIAYLSAPARPNTPLLKNGVFDFIGNSGRKILNSHCSQSILTNNKELSFTN